MNLKKYKIFTNALKTETLDYQEVEIPELLLNTINEEKMFAIAWGVSLGHTGHFSLGLVKLNL